MSAVSENLMTAGGREALDTTLARLSRRFPDLGLTTASSLAHPGVISSGVEEVDHILGGGFPRGRLVHIYGRNGAGKSSLGLRLLRESQGTARQALVIDSDHAFDSTAAQATGIDLDRVVLCRPTCIEDAFETAWRMLEEVPLEVIVIDSLASLITRHDLMQDFRDSSESNDRARFLSRSLPRLLHRISTTATTLVIINQIRDKCQALFGDASAPCGGRALRHYASVQAEVRRVMAIKKEGSVVGARTSVTITGSKVCAPYRVANFDLLYPLGSSIRHVPLHQDRLTVLQRPDHAEWDSSDPFVGGGERHR